MREKNNAVKTLLRVVLIVILTHHIQCSQGPTLHFVFYSDGVLWTLAQARGGNDNALREN